MRCKRKIYLLLSGCILLLSGCGRIVDWAKESFNQGNDLDNYAKIPRQFLRSVKVYDQFETLGVFDALWLSDHVRTEYAQLHAYKHGKSSEHKKAFLRRQLEENKHYIVFYVLSLFGKSLDIEDANWTLFLEIDGKRYAPIVKPEAIELAPEYTFFFGKRLSKFKIPYLVRFNAYDIENKPLIDENVKEIQLVFRSVEKEVELTWDLTSLIVNNMHDEKIGAT
ncbi:hypothetical protein E3J79_02680 [Candidatus Dependentiae bacterium]|nr:MAG: hypothetical protein E3J79_02680 [Candidatus Dependentiae bacterium]